MCKICFIFPKLNEKFSKTICALIPADVYLDNKGRIAVKTYAELPPAEPSEEATADVPETELAVMEGMVDMQSRIATLEAELAKLKGGK